MNKRVMWAGVALGSVILGGCASVASRVPVWPAGGQSEAVRDRDSGQCERFATDGGRTDGERRVAFAACMVARGYRASLPLRFGVDHGLVDVEAQGQQAVAQVLSDLQTCARQGGEAGRPSAQDVVAGRIGALAGSDSTQVRPHGLRSRALEDRFSSCLAARGYAAVPSPLVR